MQLRHLWPTPIAQDMLVLPEGMRRQLIAVLLRKEADREKIRDTSPDFHRFMTSKKFYASTHYNLFAEADNHPERDAILACRFSRRTDPGFSLRSDPPFYVPWVSFESRHSISPSGF